MARVLSSLLSSRTIATRTSLVAVCISVIAACSGSETPAGQLGTGGATALAGGSGNPSSTAGSMPVAGATGGGSLQLGGAFGTGGNSNVANGTGGSTLAAGGSSARGGGPNGGTASAGGSTSKGGNPSIGGMTASGGGNPYGGSSPTPSGGSASGSTSASGGRSNGTGGAGGGVTGGKSSVGGTSSGGSSSTSTGSGTTHWVGTWAASPYAVPSGNMPPSALSNSVMRQVVHVSLGGSQLRVQFSNLAGNGPVTITSAHIALCKAAPAVDSTIDIATDKALAFASAASVTIAQGKEIWSDPIDFVVGAQGNIAITTAFGSVSSTLSGHAGARTTSYQIAGSSDASAASMTSAKTVDSWYYISGIDVMADVAAKAAVAIGDSITDGRGTDTNKNNRWTDILAARLHGNAATANVALMNQGIGATNLVGTTGTAAQARFSRDVLGQSGVRYAIVYDGVNDIGSGATFASMKVAYDELISAAHTKGLLIYGGTILPFGANSYYSAAHESVRQQVNTYIKSGVFDGYIDFDAALTDGGSPPKLQTAYATWAQTDGLHPGPTGYQKMGDSVDLTLFAK